MNKGIIGLAVVVLCLSIALVGCGAPKEASSQAAIEKSKAMATVQQKTDYLVGQARAFVNSKDFEQAISIAQYTLSNVDSNSQAARGILDQARAELTAKAKKAMEDVKAKLGAFGK